MNIKIIVNPRAGDGKGRQTGFEVEKFFCEKGIEYSLDSTYRPQGATSLAKKAVSDGFNLILAVGGDGTVNEVVNGMAGSSAALAVIPAGKKNNFSRTLGLDAGNIIECCEIAMGQKSRRADLGKINGRYFVNGIGIGLNAELSKQAGIKNSLFRIFLALRNFRSPKLNIKIGDLDLSSKMVIADIANGKFLGGSEKTAPDADIEDGKLDLCVLNNVGKLGLLLRLPKLVSGTLPGSRHYKTYKGSRFLIDSADSFSLFYDGEIASESSPFHVKVAEEKLLVKSK
jgi:YegS/Rv2252/BmrU family lipid kinase